MNLRAATRILYRHRSVPPLAYLEARPEHLGAVFHLAKSGLNEVLIRSSSEKPDQLRRAICRLSSRDRALELLGTFYPELAGLHPRLRHVIEQVLEYPMNYRTVIDIARASELSTKQVALAFKRAHLRTPRRFLTLARVVWGYATLFDANARLRSARATIGFKRTKAFLTYLEEVLGISASRPSFELDKNDLALSLREWLYKPGRIAARSRNT